MTKTELDTHLWYVATNGAWRVHELLSLASGAKADDPTVQKTITALRVIDNKKAGRTDLSIWNEVMDLRHSEGKYAVQGN